MLEATNIRYGVVGGGVSGWCGLAWKLLLCVVAVIMRGCHYRDRWTDALLTKKGRTQLCTNATRKAK